MSPNDRWTALVRWLFGPRGTMAFAVALLFTVLAVSFVNVPWNQNMPPSECGGTLCDIPVSGSGDSSITGALFGPYAILVVLSALMLAACMIGGVYLAKAEGGP